MTQPFLAKLHERFGDRLGAFTSAGRRASFPLSLKYARPVTAQRMALVGNAAQTMHPVAGQGFNLGLRDAWELGEAIMRVPRAEIGNAAMLARYRESRSPDTGGSILFTDALVRLFSNDYHGINLGRGLGPGGAGPAAGGEALCGAQNDFWSKRLMDFDVIIVGAGLVGASLATALKDSGLHIALIEGRAPAAPELRMKAGTTAFMPSTPPMRASSIWAGHGAASIKAASRQCTKCTSGATIAAARLDFSAYEAGVEELAFIAESRLIQDGLWRALQEQSNVEIFCPAACAALEVGDDAAILTLQDGRTLRAKLIVGADGRESWVRAHAGIEAQPRAYGQDGVVANFETEKPHRNAAYQWFREDGILAYLPLPGNRISIVWSAFDALSQELMALPPDEFCRRVQEAGKNTLGQLRLITPPAAFSLRLLNLEHLVKPRVALIGDAAHNVHPLAGQGRQSGFPGCTAACTGAAAKRIAARLRRSSPAAPLRARAQGRYSGHAAGHRWSAKTLQQPGPPAANLAQHRLEPDQPPRRAEKPAHAPCHRGTRVNFGSPSYFNLYFRNPHAFSPTLCPAPAVWSCCRHRTRR